MLTLNDGRAELWQWDTGRTLSVDADCSQVHFSNKVFGRSIDVDVTDGAAIIPDILLQTDKDLNVWAFVGTAENGYTKISKTFKVNRRNKPADYVFTPTDQTTLQTIQSQIGDLAGLTTEAKDTLVDAINEAARTGGGGSSTVELDTTLSEAGKAADAKAVGDALADKQDTISDLEAIRTGAAKGATALQSVPNTYRTASEQDTIDSGKVDKVIGKGLSSNDYTDAAKAKVDALAPVATSGNYNDLTNKPTIPTALPNPNALTFTGAVTGSYDGSEPLTVEIPSGGGGGVDMGITGAKVGQIAKITAVDASGVPTAWSPVDFPSGGSGGAKIVCEQTELASGIIPSGEAAWSGYDLGITLADIQEWEEIFVEFFGMGTISYWSFRPIGSNIPDASWIQGSSKQVYLFEWVDSEHTYIRVKSYAIGLGGAIDGILNGGLSSTKGSSVVCIADWSGVDPTAQMILLHNVATNADVTYKVWGITKKEA